MTLTVYESVQRIDKLIDQPPPTDFQEVLALTQNPFVDAYLFTHLTRADWLVPLTRHQLLNNDAINAHPYRLSFLRRLLPEHAAEVGELLEHHQYTASQARAHFLDILLAMPTDLLRPLLNKVEGWEPDASESTFSHLLEQLAIRTLSEPELDGLDWFVVRLLLMPARREDNPYRPYRTYLGDWNFQHFLEEHRETLEARHWYIPLLVDLLAEFTALREREVSSLFDPDRRAHLSQRRHGGHDSLDELLLDELLQLLPSLVTRSTPLADFWAHLRRYPYDLFTRLRLFTLSLVSSPDPRWVRSALLDSYAFEHHSEYRDAARAHFPLLTEADQQVVWQWARRDASFIVRAWYDENEPERAERYREHDRWRKLQRLQPHLPPDLHAQWRTLAEQYGEQERHGPWIYTKEGSSSSLTTEQLAVMDVSQVVELLKGDPPSSGDEHFDAWHDRVSGLKGVLQHDVQQRPAAYLEQVEALKTIPPEYLVTVIYALRARKDAPLPPIPPLINLFHFVNRQSHAAPADQREWSWCVGHLADVFADHLLVNDSVRASFDHAPEVLPALEEGLHDPDPAPDDTGEEVKDYGDAYTRSLNVTRGKVIHALLRFIGWMHDQVSEHHEQRAQPLLNRARRVLAEHLTSGVERNSAVYAAVVPTLPWLLYTDPAYAQPLLDLLFDRRNPHVSRPVWNTHLSWNRFYSQLFTVVRPAHVAYTSQDLSAGSVAVWDTTESVQELFAHHLVMFYARGDVNFGDDDQLLELFIKHGSSKALVESVSFLSRSLRNTEGDIALYAKRLQEWWETLVREAARSRTPDEVQVVKEGFVSLFSNDRLDPEWRVSELSHVIDSGPLAAKVTMRLIAELTKLSTTHASRTFPLVEQLVRQSEPDLGVAHVTHSFLTAVEGQRGGALDTQVNHIVERMMEMGYIEGFRAFHRSLRSEP